MRKEGVPNRVVTRHEWKSTIFAGTIREYFVYVRFLKTEKKPLRVFLQDGSGDLDNAHGNWWLSNQQMAAALKFAKWDDKEVWGE